MSKKKISQFTMLRRIRNITQQELADAIGVARITISNWETGRRVPQLTITQTKALCRTLQVSIEELPDNFGPEPSNDES